MWYVYFLQLSNNIVYVGFSSNLKRRFKAHNNREVPATAPFLPAKLRSYIAVDSKETAIALEKYFKSGSGKAIALKRFLNPPNTFLDKPSLKYVRLNYTNKVKAHVF